MQAPTQSPSGIRTLNSSSRYLFNWDILKQADRHPSQRYFILKSIVLNNLYGVDIMEGAVEICKLRLFLKLVAQLESYDQIEPLPDIDFNIKSSNTLVGFTSLEEVRRAMTITPDGQLRALDAEQRKTLDRIEADAGAASEIYDHFRRYQITPDSELDSILKQQIKDGLGSLRTRLDGYQATQYGIDQDDSAAYANWVKSHQPFHWFVEFYGIMSKGGFDVVVGNPPYVSARQARRAYTVKGLLTIGRPDIYSIVVERAAEVCRVGGRTSMIAPLSLAFSEDFDVLRKYLYDHCGPVWFYSFGRIPSALFSFDTRVRNTIYLAKRTSGTKENYLTTRLHRWFDSERPFLFENLNYCLFSPSLFGGLVPELGNTRLMQGFEALLSSGDYRLEGHLSPPRKDGFPLHFKQTAYNWLTLCIERPPVTGPDGTALSQTGYGSSRFSEEKDRDLSLLLANGLLMYMWWVAIGDDFHVTRKNFTSAPLGPNQLTKRQRAHLLRTVPRLVNAMSENVVFKLNAGKNIGNYNLVRCRHITDTIDKTWLDALGLSDLWEDILLEHSLVVRTSYEDE